MEAFLLKPLEEQIYMIVSSLVNNSSSIKHHSNSASNLLINRGFK